MLPLDYLRSKERINEGIHTIELLLIGFIPTKDTSVLRVLCFKGDDRSFTIDPQIERRYRVKYYVKYNVRADELSKSASAGVTRRYISVFGRKIPAGKARASVENGMLGLKVQTFRPPIPPSFLILSRPSNREAILISAKAFGKNPLLPLAPTIDVQFVVVVFGGIMYDGRYGIRVYGEVCHDGYPAYELYIRINEGHWQRIWWFNGPLDHGQNPYSLFWPTEWSTKIPLVKYE